MNIQTFEKNNDGPSTKRNTARETKEMDPSLCYVRFGEILSSRQTPTQSFSPSNKNSNCVSSRLAITTSHSILSPDEKDRVAYKGFMPRQTPQIANQINFIERNKQNVGRNVSTNKNIDKKEERRRYKRTSKETSQNSTKSKQAGYAGIKREDRQKIMNADINEVDNTALIIPIESSAGGDNYLSLTSMSNIDPYSCD